jgi:hypothetical protein
MTNEPLPKEWFFEENLNVVYHPQSWEVTRGYFEKIPLFHEASNMSTKGHFTHEPRGVTIKLWEPKSKCPKAVRRHLQKHVVWSQILKCSMKPYVMRPSTKCQFSEFLFMWVLIHDKIIQINICKHLECHVSRCCSRPTSKRWFLKIIRLTMKHDPLDAM